MAGADSLMDDVRFLGGHGTNAPDGTRINPYNNTHSADLDILRRWDGQYPSLGVTDGGGGTFADIWTPNTFAQAGMYVSDTDTPGHVYEFSSEHHVRNEVKLVRVNALNNQFARAQAAGSLDTTFGTGGTVATTFSGQTVKPIGAVQQSNGDIVVISQFDFQSDAGTGVGVTRYTPAGKLDTTFGTKGSTLTTFSNIIFQALWFAVQSNGAIVVGGGTAPSNSTLPGANQGFGLVRFTASGALDSTFGSNGLVNTPIGPRTADPSSFLLQPNGQIIMAGLMDGNGEKPTNPDDIPEMVAVARYNTNGSLDTTFGSGGVALLNNASTFQGVSQLALLTNGDYLIVSEFGAPLTAQLSSTGVLQSSVTGGTIVNTTSTSFGELNSETLFQPNGDFIIIQVAGTINRVTSIMGQRFSATAVHDTTFSSTRFTFAGERLVAPNGIALSANGQILVAGSVNNASPIFGGLARLNANGMLDTTFDNEGTVTTDNPVNGVLVQADGNIVAVEAVGTDGIALTRYLAN